MKKSAKSNAEPVAKSLLRTTSGKARPKSRAERKRGAANNRRPEAVKPSPSLTLEEMIGNQIRSLRKKNSMTMMETAKQSQISVSMLSKIENGATSPSLRTLQGIANALNVSLTGFFSKVDEQSDASFVRAGTGLLIERRGSRAGHQYRLLGHSVSSDVSVEPYLITLTGEAVPYTAFQHDGVEFIYMLSGEIGYRHADMTYLLRSGDALFFDGGAPHGPEELRKLPSSFLSIIIHSRS